MRLPSLFKRAPTQDEIAAHVKADLVPALRAEMESVIREENARAQQQTIERIQQAMSGNAALMPGVPMFNSQSARYGAYHWNNPYRWSVLASPEYRPDSRITVQMLRNIADNYDVLRSCINHIKREVFAVPLKVVPKNDKDDSEETQEQIKFAEDFFEKKGGLGGRGRRRSHFESCIIEDLCVVGASAILYWPNRGGGVYEVLDIDAGTIRPRVDTYGWPGPNDIWYEQWVYGVITAEFYLEQMTYDGLYPRTYTPYFASPVEWLVNVVNSALRADQWNRDWLTDGNIPQALIGTPDTWTPAEIMEFAAYFDAMMDQKQRQKAKFVPGGMKVMDVPTRNDQQFQEFELWLLRRTCAMMGVQPASIGFAGEQYKVSQEESMASTTFFGVGAVLEFRAANYDDMLERMGLDRIHVNNVTAIEEKAKERAERNQILVGVPVKSINESRQEEGLDPVEGGDNILVPNNYQPLDLALNPPQPEPLGADGNPPDGDGGNKSDTSDASDADAADNQERLTRSANADARDSDAGGHWVTIHGHPLFIGGEAPEGHASEPTSVTKTSKNARPGFHAASPDERKKHSLPPAWTDVHIADSKDSALQAVGTDAKGRTQYRYSQAHTDRQAAAKFARGRSFDKALPKLMEQIGKDASDPNSRYHEEAVVLNLIAKTGFRVGGEGDTGAEKQAYGASTLLAHHAEVKGDTITFSFTGKKGVSIQKTLKDKEIASHVQARQTRQHLFDTSDARVRDYLHAIDGDFKVKDFRMWNGTAVAKQAIDSMDAPTNARDYNAKRLEVGKLVAEHLGNTPKIALESYVDPHVFQVWNHVLPEIKREITSDMTAFPVRENLEGKSTEKQGRKPMASFEAMTNAIRDLYESTSYDVEMAEAEAFRHTGEDIPDDDSPEAAHPTRPQEKRRRRALAQWTRKAISRFKEHGDASCDFADASIERMENAIVRRLLHDADSLDAVKAAIQTLQTGILFVRHCDSKKGGTETDGWTDPNLSKKGRSQAQEVADWIARRGITDLISSDLQRAQETAVAISAATGLAIDSREGLRSWRLGDMQGMPRQEVESLIADYVHSNPTEPIAGGESYQEFLARVRWELESLLDTEKTARTTGVRFFPAVVTHNRVQRAIAAMLKGGMMTPDIDTLLDMQIPDGGVLWVYPTPKGYDYALFSPVSNAQLESVTRKKKAHHHFSPTKRQFAYKWRRRARAFAQDDIHDDSAA